MSREWLAVSSFTISRATRATFYFGEVKLEDGISSMPLLHRRGNGASRFQAVPPLCTLRENHDSQPSVSRVSRFVICPCRMLFLLAAIRTRFTSGQCPRSFFDNNNGDRDGNRWSSIVVVIPPLRIRYIDMISRGEKRRKKQKKCNRDGCVMCELIDEA